MVKPMMIELMNFWNQSLITFTCTYMNSVEPQLAELAATQVPRDGCKTRHQSEFLQDVQGAVWQISTNRLEVGIVDAAGESH